MNWKIRVAFRLALAVGVAVTAVARAARGEQSNTGAAVAGTSAAQSTALTPPKLRTFVPAPPPNSDGSKARLAAGPVEVELELTIDAAGKVTEAHVLTAVGDGLDDAALAAARQFAFEPARRGAQPIPARIKYRYTFEAATPEPPVPTTGNLEGRVMVRGGDQLATGVAVNLVAADGHLVRSTVTDAKGAFTFAELPHGHYRVRLARADLAPLAAGEDIAAGELTSVTYRVDTINTAPTESALEFGATATIEAPPREVTKRSLNSDELLRVAGTRGDPLRAIEYMPGVGRSPQANFVIIRGSSPADSEVQFEGAPVFRLYHFGGLTSFVQPRLLDRIDLYPGNFSARFGRKMGGIIDVGVRDPKTDGFHGMADINLIDTSLLVEGPISKNWSFAVAAKRSYIDFFIDKLVPKDELQVVAAPVYWDYQAMVAYKPSDNDRFRAMVYGSFDDFKLILANPADTDPAIRGGLSAHSGFHRGNLLWQHKYSAAVEHEITVSAGPYSFGQKLGPDLMLEVPGYDAFLRAEWRARLSDSFRLIGGLDLSELWLDGKYNGPAITQLDGDPDAFGSLTGTTNVQIDRAYSFFRPAAYVEAIWQPTERLTLVPGVRVDHFGDIQRWTVDPRFTARYQVGATTTLKGGAGLFSQGPDFS